MEGRFRCCGAPASSITIAVGELESWRYLDWKEFRHVNSLYVSFDSWDFSGAKSWTLRMITDTVSELSCGMLRVQGNRCEHPENEHNALLRISIYLNFESTWYWMTSISQQTWVESDDKLTMHAPCFVIIQYEYRKARFRLTSRTENSHPIGWRMQWHCWMMTGRKGRSNIWASKKTPLAQAGPSNCYWRLCASCA